MVCRFTQFCKQTTAKFWLKKKIMLQDVVTGFNIGSALEIKRWATERFAQVAECWETKDTKQSFSA